MKITQEILDKYKLAGIHPVADRLPYATNDEFADLINSVKVYGIQTPISITPEAIVLDGRHRIMAALAANIDVIESIIVEPTDSLVWIMAQNNRRNFTVGQRAMIAKDIANTPHGGDRKSANWPGVDQAPDPALEPRILRYTQEQAAAIINSSPQRIRMAKVICEHAPKEDVLVRAGTMSLEAAYNIARNKKMEVLYAVRSAGVPEFPADAPMPSGTDEYTSRVLMGIDSLRELIPTLSDCKTIEEIENIRTHSQLIQTYGQKHPTELDPEIQAWAGHCGSACSGKRLEISEGQKPSKIRSFKGVDIAEKVLLKAKANGKNPDPKLKGKSVTRKSLAEKFKVYWTGSDHILDRFELTDLEQFPAFWEKTFAEYLARRKAKLEQTTTVSSTIKQQ